MYSTGDHIDRSYVCNDNSKSRCSEKSDNCWRRAHTQDFPLSVDNDCCFGSVEVEVVLSLNELVLFFQFKYNVSITLVSLFVSFFLALSS